MFRGFMWIQGSEEIFYSQFTMRPPTIVLSEERSIFPIWFAELKRTQSYDGTHNGQNKIPRNEPVEALSQGELTSPNVLSKG